MKHIKETVYNLGITKISFATLWGMLKQLEHWKGGCSFVFYNETNDYTEELLKCSYDCWDLNNTSLQIHVNIIKHNH